MLCLELLPKRAARDGNMGIHFRIAPCMCVGGLRVRIRVVYGRAARKLVLVTVQRVWMADGKDGKRMGAWARFISSYGGRICVL